MLMLISPPRGPNAADATLATKGRRVDGTYLEGDGGAMAIEGA